MAYSIICRRKDGSEFVLSDVSENDPDAALGRLRSCAFSVAASGTHGTYRLDGTFAHQVGTGFSPDGETWTAKDGTCLYIRKENTTIFE